MTYTVQIGGKSPFPLITNFLADAISRQPLPIITGPLTQHETEWFLWGGVVPKQREASRG